MATGLWKTSESSGQGVWGLSETTGATPAVLSAPTATPTGSTTADVGATTDTASGTLYALARIGGSPAADSAIEAGGQSAAVSTTTPNIPYTGLTAATLYSVDIVQKVAGVYSNVVTTTFTTDNPGGGGGGVALYADITESFSISDALSAGRVQEGAAAEALTLAEVQASAQVSAAVQAESLAPVAAQDAENLGVSGAVSESLALVDAQAAQAALNAEQAESLTPVDAQSATASFAVQLAELLALADEAVTAQLASMLESVTVADLQTAVAVFGGVVTEIAQALAAQSAQADFNASRAEALTLAQVSEAVNSSGDSASVEESVTLEDETYGYLFSLLFVPMDRVHTVPAENRTLTIYPEDIEP